MQYLSLLTKGWHFSHNRRPPTLIESLDTVHRYNSSASLNRPFVFGFRRKIVMLGLQSTFDVLERANNKALYEASKGSASQSLLPRVVCQRFLIVGVVVLCMRQLLPRFGNVLIVQPRTETITTKHNGVNHGCSSQRRGHTSKQRGYATKLSHGLE